MNSNNRRIRARFAPETRFEVTPAPAVPFRGALETELDRLKDQQLQRLLEASPLPEFNALLRRAANEAASLAWLTPYPLLVFPALFEEMAGVAVVRGRRQQQVRRRSEALLALAA